MKYDDSAEADNYTNRASQLISSVKNPQLQLRFRECFSTTMDYKRRFIESARNYYNLACDALLDFESRQDYFTKSCYCAILSKAGPQRSRMLATLFKDERSTKFPFYQVLLDMYGAISIF